MAKYPFLSEEWIGEVRRLGDEAKAEGGGAQIPHQVKMNQVITEVPFGDGTIEAHMDTSTGEMQMEMGHISDPDLTGYQASCMNIHPEGAMTAFTYTGSNVKGTSKFYLAKVPQGYHGKTMTITPIAASADKSQVREARKKINVRYRKVFEKLAE